MMPITVTNRAWAQIDALTAGQKALKIGLKKGGCAGMEYSMDLVDAPDPNDLVIEGENAKVVVAATAQMFLFGMEIDYETTLLESGFKFNNPNVVEACGCGESISFDVDHAHKD